jgi:hypothetical protein
LVACARRMGDRSPRSPRAVPIHGVPIAERPTIIDKIVGLIDSNAAWSAVTVATAAFTIGTSTVSSQRDDTPEYRWVAQFCSGSQATMVRCIRTSS